jgi:hypothetical protein
MAAPSADAANYSSKGAIPGHCAVINALRSNCKPGSPAVASPHPRTPSPAPSPSRPPQGHIPVIKREDLAALGCAHSNQLALDLAHRGPPVPPVHLKSDQTAPVMMTGGNRGAVSATDL